jgi:hypothetical protein
VTELEKRGRELLRLRMGEGGWRRIVIPHQHRGVALYALFLALVCCAVDAAVIAGALGPGGSGLRGPLGYWVGGLSFFCLVFLPGMIFAAFGARVIMWDDSVVETQSRCLFVRLASGRWEWRDIRDIGCSRLYGPRGQVVELPRAARWGAAEDELLMGLLREAWLARRPEGIPEGHESIVVSRVYEGSRAGVIAAEAIWALAGAIVVVVGFGLGGLWDDWGMLLGFALRARDLSATNLIVPPVFGLAGIALPLALIVRVSGKTDRRGDPRAIIFDNRIGRMIVSRWEGRAPDDPAASAAMPGYWYEDIEGFGVHQYVTYSKDSDGNRTRRKVHYVLHVALANGSPWMLEEYAEAGEAGAVAAELRRTVRLDRARCPEELRKPRELPEGILHRVSGETDYFVWRGPSLLLGSCLFLLFAVALIVLGFVLRKSDFLPGFYFFGAFGLILGALSVAGVVSGARAKKLAFALALDATSLRAGRVPIELYLGGAEASAIASSFDGEKPWPLASIRGISTAYTEDTYKQKTRHLKLRFERPDDGGERCRSLPIAVLSLGETVDFEHCLRQALLGRGRSGTNAVTKPGEESA